jgi:hypothetical protein
MPSLVREVPVLTLKSHAFNASSNRIFTHLYAKAAKARKSDQIPSLGVGVKIRSPNQWIVIRSLIVTHTHMSSYVMIEG